jgi:hypothetical protein
MATLGMTPKDEARADLAFIHASLPGMRLPKMLLWWAIDGDTAAIRHIIQGREDGMRKGGDSAETAMLRGDATAASVYMALARRDTVMAARLYLATTDTLADCWGEHRTALVPVLIASGHLKEAEARLERRWPGTSGCSCGVDDVMWTMYRARIFEKAGRKREAIQNYAFALAAWKNADAELQPVVREAELALVRLRNERS